MTVLTFRRFARIHHQPVPLPAVSYRTRRGKIQTVNSLLAAMRKLNSALNIIARVGAAVGLANCPSVSSQIENSNSWPRCRTIPGPIVPSRWLCEEASDRAFLLHILFAVTKSIGGSTAVSRLKPTEGFAENSCPRPQYVIVKRLL